MDHLWNGRRSGAMPIINRTNRSCRIDWRCRDVQPASDWKGERTFRLTFVCFGDITLKRPSCRRYWHQPHTGNAKATSTTTVKDRPLDLYIDRQIEIDRVRITVDALAINELLCLIQPSVTNSILIEFIWIRLGDEFQQRNRNAAGKSNQVYIWISWNSYRYNIVLGKCYQSIHKFDWFWAMAMLSKYWNLWNLLILHWNEITSASKNLILP